MVTDTYVIEGVTKAIYDAFKRPIYIEWKENSMQFPCFYVQVIESQQDLHVQRLYNRKLEFDIHYFLNEQDYPSNYREQLTSVGNNLYQVLEYIHVNDHLIRGDSMHYKVTDGVMHFYITYDVMVMKEKNRLPAMEHLDVNERSYHGDEEEH